MGYLVVPQRFEGAVVTLAGMVDVTMKIGVEVCADPDHGFVTKPAPVRDVGATETTGAGLGKINGVTLAISSLLV